MGIESEIAKLVDVDKLSKEHAKVYNDMIRNEYKAIKFSPEDVKDRVVVDIGAHVGTFSLLCQVCGAKSITAIEANPKTFMALVENLSKCPSVTSVINKAVFDGCIDSVNFTDSDVESMATSKSSQFTVSCVSLDEVLKYQSGNDIVIKMDIEGAEYSALPACPKSSLRKCRTVFLETHQSFGSFIGSSGNSESPWRTADFLRNFMTSMGFKQSHVNYMFSWKFNEQGIVTKCEPIKNAEFLKFERE